MPGLIVHAEKASFPLPCITQASQQILVSAMALSHSLFNQTPESLKKAETREQAKRTPFTPALAEAHRGKCQAMPCKEGQPQRHRCTPTLPQQVPHAKAAATLPEVTAPSNQLAQEVSSFPSKQRLARQRLFSETCFKRRCPKVSHKRAVPLPGAGCAGQGEAAGARVERAERGSSAWKQGHIPILGGGGVIYGAVLQPLLYHPCTPLVCQSERTSEAPPLRQKAREGLQEGLMAAFLSLVTENAREEVLSDVGEGRNGSDSVQEGAGKVRKQRATGTNSQSVPLPVRAAQSSYTRELLLCCGGATEHGRGGQAEKQQCSLQTPGFDPDSCFIRRCSGN